MTFFIFSLLILIILLIIGVPVAFSFFTVIFLIIMLKGYDPSFLIPYGIGKMNNILLLAIPLFILAGELMNAGNIGNKLVDFIEVFVGKLKGGLGAVVVVTSGVFGALTGSAAATLSSVGSILLPRLKAAGYDSGFSAALVANSSVLGLLIPPSTLMILYAWVGGQSVLASFLATIFPGLMVMTLLIIINFVFNIKNTNLYTDNSKESLPQFVKKASKKGLIAVPALTMPLVVLGGIYGGYTTPTEAAAVSALYAIPLGFFVYKGLNRKNFFKTILNAGVTTGVIMIMLYAIMLLSRVYITENIPSEILEFLMSISENKFIILIIINVFMIIIGMIMDDTSGVLLVTPLLLPIVIKLGIDPIQFAAIVGVNLGMGNITPPTAPLLFLGARIGKTELKTMIKPALIMIVFAWLPTLLVTTYFSEFSLFLPNLLLN